MNGPQLSRQAARTEAGTTVRSAIEARDPTLTAGAYIGLGFGLDELFGMGNWVQLDIEGDARSNP